VLGPVNWIHSISRPFQNIVADPNPNLTGQLSGGRPAAGWIRPQNRQQGR
jgi:hypothetical protein